MAVAAERRYLDVERVLDRMAITDRLFHDLRWSAPLVQSIVVELQRRKGAGTVLAIAPNALLVRCLVESGYEVEVWQHELSLPDPAHVDLITRRGSFDVLLGQVEGGPYDAIVAAYALDRSVEHPDPILARLRRIVHRDGVLLFAHKLPGGLHARREALAARAMPPDPISRPEPLNYAWFPTPVRRLFDREDIGVWATRNGFFLADHQRVLDREAVNRIVPMRIAPWLRARFSHFAQRMLPGLRECGIVVLVPRPGPFAGIAEGLDFPLVSVLVTSAPDGRLAKCLDSLAEVAYPMDRIEVLVAGGHGTKQTIPEQRGALAPLVIDTTDVSGLGVLRRLVAAARGEVLAITDGFSRVDRGWIDVGLNRLSSWCAGVRGPVWPDTGSAGPFLTLPGQRPEIRQGGWLEASNLICRKEVLAAALESPADGPAEGWQPELGCRLWELGVSPVFQDQARVQRLFPFPGGRGWIKREFDKAALIPTLVQRRPALRSGLELGYFASRRTLAFDVLLVAIAAAAISLNPWFLLAGALVWLASCHRHLYLWPPPQWRTTLRHLRGMSLRSVVWFAGLAVGSLRARTFVL